MVKIIDYFGFESHFDVVSLLDKTDKHLKKWFKKKTGCDYDIIVKKFYETGLTSYNGKIEKCYQKCWKQFVKRINEIGNFDDNRCLSKIIKLKVFLFLFNLHGIRCFYNLDFLYRMNGDLAKNVLDVSDIVKKYDYTNSCDFLHFFDKELTTWRAEFEYLKRYKYCSTYKGCKHDLGEL